MLTRAARRQVNGNWPQLPDIIPKAKKAMKIEQMKPVLARDGVKRIKMRYGPFELKAAGVCIPQSFSALEY
jgi:hypothetical protein